MSFLKSRRGIGSILLVLAAVLYGVSYLVFSSGMVSSVPETPFYRALGYFSVIGVPLVALLGFYLLVYVTRRGKLFFWSALALLVSPFLVTWLLCRTSEPGSGCGIGILAFAPFVLFVPVLLLVSLIIEGRSYMKSDLQVVR